MNKEQEEIISVVIDLLQTNNISFKEFKKLIPKIEETFLARISADELVTIDDLASKMEFANKYGLQKNFEDKHKDFLTKAGAKANYYRAVWCKNIWKKKYLYFGLGHWSLSGCRYYYVVEIIQKENQIELKLLNNEFNSLNKVKEFMKS